MLGLAALSAVLPFTLEFLALRRLTSSAFGTLMSLEPASRSTATAASGQSGGGAATALREAGLRGGLGSGTPGHARARGSVILPLPVGSPRRGAATSPR